MKLRYCRHATMLECRGIFVNDDHSRAPLLHMHRSLPVPHPACAGLWVTRHEACSLGVDSSTSSRSNYLNDRTRGRNEDDGWNGKSRFSDNNKLQRSPGVL